MSASHNPASSVMPANSSCHPEDDNCGDMRACRILDELAAQGRKPALQFLDDGNWMADCRDDNDVLTGGNGSTRLAALLDALGRL